jgi:hypothetical protein
MRGKFRGRSLAARRHDTGRPVSMLNASPLRAAEILHQHVHEPGEEMRDGI